MLRSGGEPALGNMIARGTLSRLSYKGESLYILYVVARDSHMNLLEA